MKSNAFLPQGHIRDSGSTAERGKSYRQRKNSQANSELQLETFLQAAAYRNTRKTSKEPVPPHGVGVLLVSPLEDDC
jgi:hypothetical protein